MCTFDYCSKRAKNSSHIQIFYTSAMGNGASSARPVIPAMTGGSMSSTGSLVYQCLVNAVGEDNVAFKGSLLYQVTDVRPYNLDIIVTPTAVTYPSTADQVAAIVKCAVDSNLNVQARSGGHSYANYGIGGRDGAIVVDLKYFQQFSMDKTTWQATVGAGTLLGDLTKRLHDNGGRAMAYGTCPQVGVGGHATIGGLGPTSRMWGALLDHIEEVEVVLANSTVVRASEKQYPDIFFAVKGAAASFGIVTEFKFRTQEEPGKAVLYSYTFQGGSIQEKANVFKKWQRLISDPQLSRKFASQFILVEGYGAVVTGTFFGSQTEYDSLNITSRLDTSASSNSVELKDWVGAVGHWAEDVALKVVGGVPAHFYAKSLAYKKNNLLPDEGVDKLFEYMGTADSGGAIWFMLWDLEGGAINDVAPDATAYGHRDALFFHQAYAVNPLGKVSSFQTNYSVDEVSNRMQINNRIRAFLDGINNIVIDSRPNRDQGVYAGYVDPALGADSARLYWEGNVGRLQQIKAAVDPRNVFANPQSVTPAVKSAKKRAIL
jgi:FAD/FMN-containing dehydrogenase